MSKRVDLACVGEQWYCNTGSPPTDESPDRLAAR